MTKITANQKEQILNEIKNNSQRELAKKYKVSRSCIQKILKNKSPLEKSKFLDYRIEEGCGEIYKRFLLIILKSCRSKYACYRENAPVCCERAFIKFQN